MLDPIVPQYRDEVIPDTTPVPGEPEATIRKARTIRRKVYMQSKL